MTDMTAARGVRQPFAALLALKTLGRLAAGSLEMRLPNGHLRQLRGNTPGPAAGITIHDWRLFGRVMTSGDIGLAESYMAGDWDSPDLVRFIELLAANESAVDRLARPSWWRRALLRLQHARRDNTREGSRKNIHAHYDLGNRFYETWLDTTMTYSSALYEGDPDRPLADAQRAKYERILDRLGARQGDSVLEIGCGWGGFAEAAARRGVKVHGITISEEQLAYARARLARAGLSDVASVEFRDYRDLEGQFDHVVSIEMIEAVGERHWPSYFSTLRDRLRRGGKAIVQAIVIDEPWFQRYRNQPDFIQTYVFPGGMLPAVSSLRDQAARVGMALSATHGFGCDYARTLEAWLERFDAARERVQGMGFDDRFVRMWRYYLAYCAAGFATGRTDVVQAEFMHV